MDLLDWLKAHDAGPIIKSVFALSYLCYYIWLRVSSQRVRQKSTATSKANRHASVLSAAIPSQEQVSNQCMYHKVNQFSNKELLALIVDIRERLANLEGRVGIYPPRRGLEPPIPEPVALPESGEPSQS